jgi:hypothetical protein
MVISHLWIRRLWIGVPQCEVLQFSRLSFWHGRFCPQPLISPLWPALHLHKVRYGLIHPQGEGLRPGAELVSGFLGLGSKPPEPERGLMLNTLRTAIYVQPMVAALPGAMIFITSISLNLLSDGLRSAMEVK